MELPTPEEFSVLLNTVKGCLDNVSVIKRLFAGKQEPQEINSMQLQLAEAVGKIVQAQIDHMALLQENAQLKQSLKEKDQWDSERERYHLHATRLGDSAYILKQTNANDDPIHAICTQCYEEGKKSILNHSSGILRCHKCGKKAGMEESEKKELGLSTSPPRRSIGARVV